MRSTSQTCKHFKDNEFNELHELEKFTKHELPQIEHEFFMNK